MGNSGCTGLSSLTVMSTMPGNDFPGSLGVYALCFNFLILILQKHRTSWRPSARGDGLDEVSVGSAKSV